MNDEQPTQPTEVLPEQDGTRSHDDPGAANGIVGAMSGPNVSERGEAAQPAEQSAIDTSAMSLIRITSFVAVVAALGCWCVKAAEPAECRWTEDRITIDGVADEAVGENAPIYRPGGACSQVPPDGSYTSAGTPWRLQRAA